VKGFIKVDTFYKEFNFDYINFKKNWPTFKRMLYQGVSRKENYITILSSATIIAFADLEGIICESERYANELALFDENGKKVVIDLLHDPYVEFEEDIYVFEKKNSDAFKYNTLKTALAVGMGNTQNPEYGNKYEFIKPIMKLPTSIKRKVEQNSDEFFLSRFNKNETTPHLDCMCSLSCALGLSLNERKNLFPTLSYWDIKKKEDCDLDKRQKEVEIEKKNNDSLNSDHTFRQKSVQRERTNGIQFKLTYTAKSDAKYASDGQISHRSNSSDLVKSLEEKKREYSAAEIANNHFVEMKKRNQYVKDKAKVHHIV
jgi:hypothetical protein